MKGFLLPRKLGADMEKKMRAVCPEEADYFMENLQGALPALSMVNQVALNTAFANDQAPDLSFAQQLLGMGDAGDVLLAISTSGNSTNVIYALQMAKVKGVRTIALTGKSGARSRAVILRTSRSACRMTRRSASRNSICRSTTCSASPQRTNSSAIELRYFRVLLQRSRTFCYSGGVML